ncbi:metal-dependent hydrolase [Bacillus solimangrovi]|uniref:Uncharacterized protein n=1 Tax=Bacillus solimangrovi TaxID=1305675 RepID=A0A1E5LCB0_9BACI|nr:metal-dependent hydrolase [Bacillus solimangrovi]OEH91701.1 hypothetical protein BFG57_18000 [Bacillus solimangrovi]
MNFFITMIGELGYHGGLGALVAYVIGRKKVSQNHLWLLLLIGFVAGISPDLTLAFQVADSILYAILGAATPLGIISSVLYSLSHSIFIAPSFSLGMAIIIRRFLPELNLQTRWMIMFFSLLIGHLSMDFLDNGLPILFPIMSEKNIGLNLLNGTDGFLIVLFISLLALIILGRNNTKRKWTLSIIAIGVALFGSYVGFKGYSESTIQQQLSEQYPDVDVYLKPASSNPFSSNLWTYEVRLESGNPIRIIYGQGSFSKLNEQERILQTELGYKLSVKELTFEDQQYFIGINYKITDSDDESNYETDVKEEDLFVFLHDKKAEELVEIKSEKRERILSELPSMNDEQITYQNPAITIEGFNNSTN